MPTVLIYEHVTGGGMAGHDLPASWAVEGGAMRRALARDFASVPGVSVRMSLDSRLPDEPGPWTVVRIGPSDTPLADDDYTALIAPETEGCLDRLTGRFANSLGGSLPAIQLATLKPKLLDTLSQNGILVPLNLQVTPRIGLPKDFHFPAVLKPIDGAGAMDTYLIHSASDPLISEFSLNEGLLEQFIPGEPRSATFLKPKGETSRFRLVGVSRQTIVIDGGRFTYQGGVLLDEPLPSNHPARRAIEVIPNLYGLVGVDYIHDPETGNATVIEINPRPTTSCVAIVAVLEPGQLASAWLNGYENVSETKVDYPMARPRMPLIFSADGSVGSRTRCATENPE